MDRRREARGGRATALTRFRPNVVVAGAAAFAEDGWHLVRIGDVRFRVAKPCGRCVLTTVDPDTAVKGKEPLATLARHRRWDGNVWFGVNLIRMPRAQAGTSAWEIPFRSWDEAGAATKQERWGGSFPV